ncbi:BglG family transcription antiterminator [Clostridium beijerinckii]|uniref:Putative licABCH operon regulator n=1 Tax=Clostridium beijerinckii TaxID=1520 RepID=A0A1S8S6D6_CLOBE|nr:PTS sugar transporter subunit IIA [Clostridium beijerinckii]NRY63715.1 lichenan operon transcriptional antiterminator [Clostridium beijerinckii]OOM60875.1 putative licABCH operon regulator [Clostridium beijerinckii]
MRFSQIMSDFIDNEDYCSIEYFIHKYKVSKRTIQSDISYLMRISASKGFEIHIKRVVGYLLEIKDDELFGKFLKTLDENIVFKIKERPSQVLAFLSVQDEYISMDKVADTFQVSKTLIKHDIKKVEELAKGYHMALEKKSHHGIRIISSDRYLKKYLCKEYQTQNVFVRMAVDGVVIDFSNVESHLIREMNREKLNINYNELLNMIVFLKLMVYIALKGNKQYVQDYEFHESSPIEKIAASLINTMEKKYNVCFDKDSVEELIEVMKKNIRRKDAYVSFTDNLIDDIEVFLKKTDETYDTHFFEDQELKRLLLSHMSLLVDRLHNKISYKNALANELSITYPMIFNIAIQFCDILHEKYNAEFTFDEIGFVAMHFAAHMVKEKQLKLQSYNKICVVCSSGGGSAYMIKMQLESIFPKAEVKTFSFLQQDEMISYKPDIIFTVIPISYDAHIPVIYIKELLDDKDLYRIRQILQCDDYDPYTLINENPIYYSYFSKEFFNITEEDDYEHLIRAMAEDLEKKGYGKEGYAELVMEREAFISTIYLNGVCIPHPIETDALRNTISVSILKKPFIWLEKEVRIIFMICLKKEQVEVYKDITKKLYQLMREPKYLERVIRVKSFEELMAVMKEMGGVNYE